MVEFKVLSGGAIGSDHVDTATNGQDARSVKQSPGALVLAVADGCGSKPHSGVGAGTFVHICTTYFAQAVRRGQNISDIRVRRHVRERLVADMTDFANKMAGDDSVAQYIGDNFLFTLLVAVVANGKLTILRIGDGVYGVNGKLVKLKPTKGNKPVYLAYAITGSPITDDDPSLLDFEVVAEYDLQDVDTFWIGSDGTEEMFEATGKNAGGNPIESPEELLDNPHYNDPDYPNRLSERFKEVVLTGFGSDDISFVGVHVIHPTPEPDTTEDDTLVKVVVEPGKAADQTVGAADDGGDEIALPKDDDA